jgi:hypothetical protein
MAEREKFVSAQRLSLSAEFLTPSLQFGEHPLQLNLFLRVLAHD